jgi:hypothetical protein
MSEVRYPKIWRANPSFTHLVIHSFKIYWSESRKSPKIEDRRPMSDDMTYYSPHLLIQNSLIQNLLVRKSEKSGSPKIEDRRPKTDVRRYDVLISTFNHSVIHSFTHLIIHSFKIHSFKIQNSTTHSINYLPTNFNKRYRFVIFEV